MKAIRSNSFFSRLRDQVVRWCRVVFLKNGLEDVPLFPQVRVLAKHEVVKNNTVRYSVEFETSREDDNTWGFRSKQYWTESLSVRPEAYEAISTGAVLTKTPSVRSTIDSSGRFLLCFELTQTPMDEATFTARIAEVEASTKQQKLAQEQFYNFEDHSLLPKIQL